MRLPSTLPSTFYHSTCNDSNSRYNLLTAVRYLSHLQKSCRILRSAKIDSTSLDMTHYWCNFCFASDLKFILILSAYMLTSWPFHAWTRTKKHKQHGTEETAASSHQAETTCFHAFTGLWMTTALWFRLTTCPQGRL